MWKGMGFGGARFMQEVVFISVHSGGGRDRSTH